MGGRDWLVPPLTLGQLRYLMPKVRQLTEFGVAMSEEQISTMCEIVATALRRNYPDTTNEAVAELLDMGNARDVLQAVLTGSGMRPRAPGEAMPQANGALETSTGSLPLPADTATP